MSDGPSDVEDEVDGPPPNMQPSKDGAIEATSEGKRYVNYQGSYHIPNATFKVAMGGDYDPEIFNFLRKQRRSSKRVEKAFQTNIIISIHNGDKLIRVVMRENLPFMCGFCGEAFSHTRLLQEHVEGKHHFFQATIDHDVPRKLPIVIERDFANMDRGKKHNTTLPEPNEKDQPAGNPSTVEGPPSSVVTQETYSDDEPMDCGPPEAPSDSESEGMDLQTKFSEHATASNKAASPTDGGVEHILTEMSRQIGVPSGGRPVGKNAGRTETSSSAVPASNQTSDSSSRQENVLTAQATPEKIQIIVPKLKSKKHKKNKRKSQKEKYSFVLNAEHCIPIRSVPEKRRRQAKNGDEVKTAHVYCIVCNLFCQTRYIGKKHAAEVHNIFVGKKEAEKALEERKKREQDGEMDGMQDQNSDPQVTADIELIKCDLCDTYVFDKNTMVKHMRAHCGITPIKCDICQEGVRLWNNNQLEEMKDLAERIMSKDRRPEDLDWTDGKTKSIGWPNSDIIHTCHECDEPFYHRYHASNHCSRFHAKVTCKLCGIVAPTLTELTKHSKDTHKPGMYRCKYCPRGFHDQGKYNFHLKGHMGIFKCNSCGRSFMEKATLDKHLNTIDACSNVPNSMGCCRRGVRAKAFTIKTCSVCNKSFVREGSYAAHMLNVHKMGRGPIFDPKKVNCKICGANVSKGSLGYHMTVHQQNKHSCTYPGCKKNFPTKRLLDLHLDSHERAPTYVCEDCGKTFTWHGSLRLHQKTHRERMGRCIFCSEEFRGRASLSRHMQEAHNHDLSFSCGICEKQFANRQRLISHAQVHCERPITYLCDKCPAAFGVKQYLDDHQGFHTNLPYVCAVCRKAFRRLDCLKKHHLKEHVDQNSYPPGLQQVHVLNGSTQLQIDVPGYSATETVVIENYPSDQGTNAAIAAIVNQLQN